MTVCKHFLAKMPTELFFQKCLWQFPIKMIAYYHWNTMTPHLRGYCKFQNRYVYRLFMVQDLNGSLRFGIHLFNWSYSYISRFLPKNESSTSLHSSIQLYAFHSPPCSLLFSFVSHFFQQSFQCPPLLFPACRMVLWRFLITMRSSLAIRPFPRMYAKRSPFTA